VDLSERAAHKEIYQMHKDLLKLRREDPVFRAQGAGGIDGAVLAPKTFLLRFFDNCGDRLLVINLDVEFAFDPAPEPLLAPPENMQWNVLWSSAHPDYGGQGAPVLVDEGNWTVPGHAALVLAAKITGSETSAAPENNLPGGK
jgi:maltooligosyltrehalose trehalohydrolase